MQLSTSEQLLELYQRNGAQTYGEDITQTEHAVQCAELARREGQSDALVTAALLHDIGHLLEATSLATGNYKHDALGASYLSQYFAAGVTEPIRLHAQAKRYLCAVEPGYLERLSAVSVDSLHHQGGLMSEEEQRAFLAEPYASDAIKLRRWDDEGKVEELSGRAVGDYIDSITACLLSDAAESIAQGGH
ncbi:MAG: HD domain-containing protein [Pseudomonadales bacterium]